MKFRKTIAAGLTVAMLAGSCLTASAAQTIPADAKNLIINVEAYKAAYPDLAAAFGNNTDAYVTHYLTCGVYEGRTKGVLFDPLTYAAAYSDIYNAYGYDVAALVNHYVTCGIKENRTMGTAHGYADIAAAESAGLTQYYAPKSSKAALQGSSGNAAIANVTAGSAAAVSSATATGSATVTSAAPILSIPQFSKTTSIYHDDGKTLWRVEYYDEGGQLKQYSDVQNVDTTTNSYTEYVYSYDDATQTEILERTDTYVNGVLQSSVSGR